jgi:FtsP/CotA-like multicopper oxidase with cupredoxin domain
LISKNSWTILFALAVSTVSTYAAQNAYSAYENEEYESVAAQHAKDKRQIKKTLDELQDVRSKMNNAAANAEQLQNQLAAQQQVKQLEITAKECSYEFAPGLTVDCLSYNGQVPGPTLRVSEGDPVRLIVHNKLDVPTSLYFQGLPLPQNVDGLPRAGAGLIAPGQTYTYQFIAPRAGTYWYHPQIIHGDQQDRGLLGALIVDSKEAVTSPTDLDQVMMISKWVGSTQTATVPVATTVSKEHPAHAPAARVHMRALSQKDVPFPSNAITYFLVNGKSAPFIPALEVTSGAHVRLHVINTTCDSIPLALSGHMLQATNDPLNPLPPPADTAVLAPGSSYIVEFSCDNPGVWSLGSTIPAQNETRGNFPGGIARAVRYSGSAP